MRRLTITVTLVAALALTGCTMVSNAIWDEQSAAELTSTMLTNQWEVAKVYALAQGRDKVTAEDLSMLETDMQVSGATFRYTVEPGPALFVEATLGQFTCTATASNDNPAPEPVCQES